MPLPEAARLAALARTTIDDGLFRADLGAYAQGFTSLGGAAPRLAGRSVMIATEGQIAAACALVELDGLARRLVVAPPDLAPRDLAAFLEDGEVETLVTDRADLAAADPPLRSEAERGRGTMRSMVEGAATSSIFNKTARVTTDREAAAAPSTAYGGPPPPLRGGGCAQRTNPADLLASVETIAPSPLASAGHPALPRDHDTEWVLATSGTLGRPKLVVHTLAALTAAVAQAPPGAAPRVWATFYDIRRYGGLQIFLRAILNGTDLIVSAPGEALADHLARLGRAGVSSMSGTPSHWRRVLMSGGRDAIRPDYIRLSGEIADQMVLDALAEAWPAAAVGHAYASTEAGVGFAVDDGREGFPATLLDAETNGVAMKVEDGTLRLRSTRAASRYLGAAAAALKDADGYVDSGDLVEIRDGRCFFVGRRGGIINVGGLKVNPEEVEGAINAHPRVRMSLVKARRNPLTGAIVVADVVPQDGVAADETLKGDILALCRERLPAHKVPALVRFVPALPLTAAGKLAREDSRGVGPHGA